MNVATGLKDITVSISVVEADNKIPSTIFRQILVDEEISQRDFNSMLRDYVREQVPNDIRAQVSLSGNIKTELGRSEMTWKVLSRALAIIGRSLTSIRMTIV